MGRPSAQSPFPQALRGSEPFALGTLVMRASINYLYYTPVLPVCQ